MIPEDEHIMIGRVFLLPPFQKVGECFGFAHILLLKGLKQIQFAVLYLVALRFARADVVVTPCVRPARLNDDVHIALIG